MSKKAIITGAERQHPAGGVCRGERCRLEETGMAHSLVRPTMVLKTE